MNNVQSRFAINPTSLGNISRSRFDRSFDVKTTFNVGELVPIFCDEFLPGDTFSVDTSLLVRMITPRTPVMDNLYLDLFFFSCPNRLLWTHWKELMGENNATAWESNVEYSVPQILPGTTSLPSGVSYGYGVASICDYLGAPVECGISMSALPVRAYCLIWNEWFRDQNLQNPLQIDLGDSNVTHVNSDDIYTSSVTGGKLLPVSKYHDYFTSALPSPLKAPEVLLPFGDIEADGPLNLGYYSGSNLVVSDVVTGIGTNLGSEQTPFTPVGINLNNGMINGNDVYYSDGLSIANSAPTINALRQAFQIQRLYEKDARGGTRYIEVIKSHFGVTSSDARLQRPEYLGGKRIPIQINQVLQTSSVPEQSTPLGTTSAYSLTGDSSNSFTKSFEEHGWVIGLACVRQQHTYQQGMNRKFLRKDRFDFYWPTLANLGEQPIHQAEIYAKSANSEDIVFGYQEAWAEYRYHPNIVTAHMRTNSPFSLDVWHYADWYDSAPVLGPEWIKEDKRFVNRTLAVIDSSAHQLFGDFHFNYICTRPMPVYSVPGLIDHN